MSYGWRREGGAVAEVCDECGFDSRRISDVMAGLRAVLVAMQVLVTDPAATRRPAAETWSATEYVDHSIAVIDECLREVAELADLTIAEPPDSCEAALVRLEAFGAEIEGLDLRELRVDASFATLTGTDNLLHALHDAEHHLLDIRRGYAKFALARGEDLHTNVR